MADGSATLPTELGVAHSNDDGQDRADEGLTRAADTLQSQERTQSYEIKSQQVHHNADANAAPAIMVINDDENVVHVVQSRKQDTEEIDGKEYEEPNSTEDSADIKSNLSKWYRKRYLGGYRDKRSGKEYFHADCQTTTAGDIQASRKIERFHRDTQTIYTRNRTAQTTKDTATQMSKNGCFVTSRDDVVISVGQYMSADEYHAMIEKKVIQIQCWVRCIFARRLAERLKREKVERDIQVKEREARRKELAEKKRMKEIESRLHPRTSKDFEMLYHGLEIWRQQETEKINKEGYSEPARLAALANLLDQEAALIQKIDRLKNQANEENREQGIIKLLEKMAAPKKWAVRKGFVQVDTPTTIRARELRDLYHALNVSLVTVDERLQILLHVKYTVKEFDCTLTRDIVELIDREADLLSRGRDAKSLSGLRQRLSSLFLQFIQTPEFNPEAANFQKFPQAGESWKRDQAVYYCRSCTKYLPSTAFYLSTTMRHLGKCKTCMIKGNIATKRKDESFYANMLRVCKIQESAKLGKADQGSGKSIESAVQIMQEGDMEYVIDTMWNRQSAISGSKTIADLVLVRWDLKTELSPWNCILLTKREAITHEAQDDPISMYGDEFVQKIQQKLLLAKRHFSQLPQIRDYLQNNYQEDNFGRIVPKNPKLAITAV